MDEKTQKIIEEKISKICNKKFTDDEMVIFAAFLAGYTSAIEGRNLDTAIKQFYDKIKDLF